MKRIGFGITSKNGVILADDPKLQLPEEDDKGRFLKTAIAILPNQTNTQYHTLIQWVIILMLGLACPEIRSYITYFFPTSVAAPQTTGMMNK